MIDGNDNLPMQQRADHAAQADHHHSLRLPADLRPPLRASVPPWFNPSPKPNKTERKGRGGQNPNPVHQQVTKTKTKRSFGFPLVVPHHSKADTPQSPHWHALLPVKPPFKLVKANSSSLNQNKNYFLRRVMTTKASAQRRNGTFWYEKGWGQNGTVVNQRLTTPKMVLYRFSRTINYFPDNQPSVSTIPGPFQVIPSEYHLLQPRLFRHISHFGGASYTSPISTYSDLAFRLTLSRDKRCRV